MKRKHSIAIAALTLFLFLAAACLLALSPVLSSKLVVWAVEPPLKIFINETLSQMKATEVKGVKYVPLYFPVEEESNWEVKMKLDKKTNTVKIEMNKKETRLRGDEKCFQCWGTGKCQGCYPAGSGKNTNGDTCIVCNGAGKCPTCGGSGKY